MPVALKAQNFHQRSVLLRDGLSERGPAGFPVSPERKALFANAIESE
jgi:hypothetical protein